MPLQIRVNHDGSHSQPEMEAAFKRFFRFADYPAEGRSRQRCPKQLPQPPRRSQAPGVPAASRPVPAEGWGWNRESAGSRHRFQPGKASARREKTAAEAGRSPAICWCNEALGFRQRRSRATRALCRPGQQPRHLVGAAASQRCLQWRAAPAAWRRQRPSRARPAGQTKGRRLSAAADL